MRKKKILIGIIVVAIIAVLTAVIVKVIQYKKFEEGGYLTKGEYFKMVIDEYSMTSQKYTYDEIKNATDYKVYADIMHEWEYITRKQAESPNEPLTKDLLAEATVKQIHYDKKYKVNIKDIKKCINKQAIMDAVGMGIFELENGKFNPKEYVTKEDVIAVFKKTNTIEAKPSGTPAKVDWSDLKINIDGINYSYPYSISQFITNGWQVDDQNKINQTVDEASKVTGEISIDLGDGFTEYSFPIEVYLHKGDAEISVIVDSTQSNTLVKDANIMGLATQSADFEFYGVKKGFTVKKVQEIFGTKNFAIIKFDESVKTEYHSYIGYQGLEKGVRFILDDKSELVRGIDISIEK